VFVDGVAETLDNEHVGAPDILLDLDEDFAIGEPCDSALAESHAEVVRDFFGERDIRIAGEYFQRVHAFLPALRFRVVFAWGASRGLEPFPLTTEPGSTWVLF